MIGGLQIRSLMNEIVGAKRMTLKAFHDAFLREGQIPIEIIRGGADPPAAHARLLRALEILRRAHAPTEALRL